MSVKNKIQYEETKLFSFLGIQASSEATHSTAKTDTSVSILECKVAGGGDWPLTSSYSVAKNLWSYTVTPSCLCRAVHIQYYLYLYHTLQYNVRIPPWITYIILYLCNMVLTQLLLFIIFYGHSHPKL
jgi:hypothetical protein